MAEWYSSLCDITISCETVCLCGCIYSLLLLLLLCWSGAYWHRKWCEMPAPLFWEMEGEKLKWLIEMAMSLHVYLTVISEKDQLMKYENIKLINTLKTWSCSSACHDDTWESGVTVPLILNFGTTWWVVTFMSHLLYPWKKRP